VGEGTLRFVTDNDVDALVARELTAKGYEAWTAAEAQLAADPDVELAVYAQDRGAVLISHDRDFAGWRRRNTFGRHVWLNCDQIDAPVILLSHLDEFTGVLERREHVLVEVRRDSFHVHKPRWD
jgi:predicted nuclease of predicted toxin-antitoxin system